MGAVEAVIKGVETLKDWQQRCGMAQPDNSKGAGGSGSSAGGAGSQKAGEVSGAVQKGCAC